MSALDRILELLGTNRTRMEWKLRAWRNAWDRRMGSAKNRAQAIRYAHQVCPRCTHPAGADEKICTRCGEPLGGVIEQRVRRVFGALWDSDTPVVATFVTCAIAAIYVVTLLWGSRTGLASGFVLSPHPLALDRFGALGPTAIEGGQWWRLSTSTFLHLDPLHLAFNLMSLWAVAIYLEEVIGKGKTLALYLGLGLVASAVSLVWHMQTTPYWGGSAGASGAVCGLIGVCLGFSLRRRNAARHLRGHYIGWAIWIAILGLSGWRIDNAGHLGGFVPGVVLGLLVRRRSDTGAIARRVWSSATAALVAVTLAALVLASQHPLPDDVLEAVQSSHDHD